MLCLRETGCIVKKDNGSLVFSTDDIPIQMAKAEGDMAVLGAITEEKEDGVAPGIKGETTPEIVSRRSLPKMAVSFGKKTKEKLTIKTSSSDKLKTPAKTLVNGSGDISETEENGDLAHELTPVSLSENGSEMSTPVNLRKSSGPNIELEPSRSMQVSSV